MVSNLSGGRRALWGWFPAGMLFWLATVKSASQQLGGSSDYFLTWQDDAKHR